MKLNLFLPTHKKPPNKKMNSSSSSSSNLLLIFLLLNLTINATNALLVCHFQTAVDTMTPCLNTDTDCCSLLDRLRLTDPLDQLCFCIHIIKSTRESPQFNQYNLTNPNFTSFFHKFKLDHDFDFFFFCLFFLGLSLFATSLAWSISAKINIRLKVFGRAGFLSSSTLSNLVR